MFNNSISFMRFALVALVVSVAGCSKDSTTPLSPPSTASQPVGTITGLIRNATTAEPVAGAKVSVGYNGQVWSTVSDSAGAFSFANVPAGKFQMVGGAPILSGNYTLTFSLVNRNAAQTDPGKRYRDYYYSNATITFTALGQGDSSSINGMVGSVLEEITYLNTTVKGQVVDRDMQPVANALVTIYDQTITPGIALAQTSTASDGTYQFTHVDNGIMVTIGAVSSDGSLQGNLPAAVALPTNVVVNDSLRSAVTVERLQILPSDDTPPYVIDISPENNADMSPSGLQIVYTFSEPIKQNAYTRTDLPPGSNTMIDDMVLDFAGMKKTAADVNFGVQWNSSYSQLTITPQGIVGSGRYTFDMTGVFNSGKFEDAAGNAIVNNARITGDFEVLNFTTSGGTTAPSTPVVTRRIVAGYFDNLDFDGGNVGLEWNYDANVRSYNVYKSVNGSPYQIDQTDVYAVQYSENSGSLVIPLNAQDPLSAGSVSYVVRAVSRDLVESASSNVITVTDAVKPQLLNAAVAAAPGTNNYIYTLRFSEPLTVSAAQNTSNYLFTGTGGVTFTRNSANYIGFSGGSYVVELSVTTSAAIIPGYTLVVSGVTDLAGNGMDSNANSQAF